MRIIETNHGGNWIDRLLNSWPLLLDTESIRPLLRLTLGHKREGRWHWGDVLIGRDPVRDPSLYRNGVVFIRIMLPFFIGVLIRWSGKNPTAKEYAQWMFGWKLNGRFGITAPWGRWKSDVSSAEGEHGANHGQATGWEEGTK